MTDDVGATSSPASNDVSATDPPPAFALTATKTNNRGTKGVLLEWTPSVAVNVWRGRPGGQTSEIATGAPPSQYEDVLGRGGDAKGTWIYFICDAANPTACSPQVEVTF